MFVATVMFHGAGVASQPTAADKEVVALAVHKKDSTLFKLTPKTIGRSSDDGATWISVPAPGSPATGGIATIAVSSQSKDVLYVGGPRLGVWRSADGGRNWTRRNQGLPSQNVAALAAHSEQADTVYAYLPGEGIFRSQDGGANWRLTDRGPRAQIRHFVHSNMPGSMETGWLFAASAEGVRRSMDCFCGWHKAGELAGEVHAVSYDPEEPQRVYAAADSGLFISEDGGETWAGMKSPGGRISALVAATAGTLYAATDGVLYRTRDRGANWEKVDA